MLRTELIAKPRVQSSQNRGLKPSFTSVMMKVMIKDITTDVNVANKSSFADTFKLSNRTNSAFTDEKGFVNISLKKL
jgi:hypothetical protein